MKECCCSVEMLLLWLIREGGVARTIHLNVGYHRLRPTVILLARHQGLHIQNVGGLVRECSLLSGHNGDPYHMSRHQTGCLTCNRLTIALKGDTMQSVARNTPEKKLLATRESDRGVKHLTVTARKMNKEHLLEGDVCELPALTTFVHYLLLHGLGHQLILTLFAAVVYV